MFNNTPEDERDFCESYKSQILGHEPIEEKGSLFIRLIKLLIIFILLVLITGISFYGYTYFIKNEKLHLSNSSLDITDEDLVVQAQDIEVPSKKEIVPQENHNLALPPVLVSPQVEMEEDINKIADDIKKAIAQSELKEENETKDKEKNLEELIIKEELEVPSVTAEGKYLEELADLSKEIDKERNQ